MSGGGGWRQRRQCPEAAPLRDRRVTGAHDASWVPRTLGASVLIAAESDQCSTPRRSRMRPPLLITNIPYASMVVIDKPRPSKRSPGCPIVATIAAAAAQVPPNTCDVPFCCLLIESPSSPPRQLPARTARVACCTHMSDFGATLHRPQVICVPDGLRASHQAPWCRRRAPSTPNQNTFALTVLHAPPTPPI